MEDSLLIALQKARHYCAYQPRCHNEVREKLYSFPLHKKDVELIITQLIEEDCLNEERFAIAYTRGKFKLKHWGKGKIKYALKQKHISDYCIRKALATISASDYSKTFASVANKKLQTIKNEKNIFIKKKKMQHYLQQKGFEIKMINDYLKAL